MLSSKVFTLIESFSVFERLIVFLPIVLIWSKVKACAESCGNSYHKFLFDGKELNIPVSYENIISDFMSEYDKQYEYTTDEEYYSRHNPQPFEFEVNVIWKS